MELLLISKIPHFESNSQLIPTFPKTTLSCYWYQRYLILKAIHNSAILYWFSGLVVTDIKDTSFWKQFTTGKFMGECFITLLLISKIPHFESNSQRIVRDIMTYRSCYWYQRYLILKAIHNQSIAAVGDKFVVTDIKDTSFWKQFTTQGSIGYGNYELLLISKIPHFESNSQLEYDGSYKYSGCYWYQRYLILKAIHN